MTFMCFGEAWTGFVRNDILEMCNCLPDCTLITYDVDFSQIPPHNVKVNAETSSSSSESRYDCYYKKLTKKTVVRFLFVIHLVL